MAKQRVLGKTEFSLNPLGLGCWQIGADWGPVDDDAAQAIVQSAVREGVNFFDTADVYGDGRSERILSTTLREHAEVRCYVATKIGRRAPNHHPDDFSFSRIQEWVDRSRRNLETDVIDLLQVHCPPSGLYDLDTTYENLDLLIENGSVRHYGFSVNTCEEALRAMNRSNVSTIQIVLNPFRQKPREEVLPTAAAANVGVIARVPLASGLLSGKFARDSVFDSSDHRNYNRDGSHFNIGETFSGVPYEIGIDAAVEFAEIARSVSMSPTAMALEWILSQSGVSVVIPGASSYEQVEKNVRQVTDDSLSADTIAEINSLYSRKLRSIVHDRW